jgi:hypothetical protein
MALRQSGSDWYGDSQADIRATISRYSVANGYGAHHFADATCACGGTCFWLVLDGLQGVAIRICPACDAEHPIGDSDEFLKDVRWLYLGCRCPECGLTGVYGDWKNEYIGYKELLARV